MQTYPDKNNQDGPISGFEIDNIHVSLGEIVRILRKIDGVTEIKKRSLFSKQGEHIHIRFKYMEQDCIVLGAPGDSSSYWIGVKDQEINKTDIRMIKIAFQLHNPGTFRRIFGNMLTKKLFSRSKKR